MYDDGGGGTDNNDQSNLIFDAINATNNAVSDTVNQAAAAAQAAAEAAAAAAAAIAANNAVSAVNNAQSPMDQVNWAGESDPFSDLLNGLGSAAQSILDQAASYQEPVYDVPEGTEWDWGGSSEPNQPGNLLENIGNIAGNIANSVVNTAPAPIDQVNWAPEPIYIAQPVTNIFDNVASVGSLVGNIINQPAQPEIHTQPVDNSLMDIINNIGGVVGNVITGGNSYINVDQGIPALNMSDFAYMPVPVPYWSSAVANEFSTGFTTLGSNIEVIPKN